MKLSPKKPPKIAKSLSSKTLGPYRFDNGEIAFGKIRRINGKEVREELKE